MKDKGQQEGVYFRFILAEDGTGRSRHQQKCHKGQTKDGVSWGRHVGSHSFVYTKGASKES